MQTRNDVNLLAILLDGFEASLLALFLVIIAPWESLRNFGLGRYIAFAKALLPEGLLSAVFQALIDDRFGITERSHSTLESVISELEEAENASLLRVRRTVLIDLYVLLARMQLRRGLIEDAALTVIRAERLLKLPYLPSLSHFTARSAQLIRAGLQAGRLLEEKGVTTVVLQPVMPPPFPPPRSSRKPDLRLIHSKRRTEDQRGSHEI